MWKKGFHCLLRRWRTAAACTCSDVNSQLFGLTLSLILLFGFCQQPQPGIPFRLECIRYQTVAWVHLHVPSLGQTRFLTGSLDLCPSQAISFFEPSPDFFLNSQRYFQCYWSDAGN
jgi:hypothetical protein